MLKHDAFKRLDDLSCSSRSNSNEMHCSAGFVCSFVLALIVVSANLFVVGGSPVDVAIVVQSQSNSFHDQRACRLQQTIYDQAEALNVRKPTVLLAHEKWPLIVGAWTVLPLLPLLIDVVGNSKSAILFCEDDVTIDLDRLMRKLGKLDLNKELFLGRALKDLDATIIHHFAFHENPSSFLYPDFASGFLISLPLLKRLASRLKNTPPIDFTIDAQHELAMYIWDGGSGVRLTNVSFLCGYTPKSKGCAVWRTEKAPDCVLSVSDSDIFFAVKTCHKFHKDRIPVLKSTWGNDTTEIEYFSDVDDSTIPTTTLGVPNTERGHCGKFMAILKHVYEKLKSTDYKWIVVVDDDTLLSVSRLRRLLSCYNPSDLVVLGERYGYGVVKGYGYDYITLGGGMAVSRAALIHLIEGDSCHCASDDSPDDMTFGLCLKHLEMPVIHSPLFHQARPIDYATGYLANQEPVSFHRHWMIDPISSYKQWLVDDRSVKSQDSQGIHSSQDHSVREDL